MKTIAKRKTSLTLDANALDAARKLSISPTRHMRKCRTVASKPIRRSMHSTNASRLLERHADENLHRQAGLHSGIAVALVPATPA